MSISQRWIAHDLNNTDANLKAVNPFNHFTTQSQWHWMLLWIGIFSLTLFSFPMCKKIEEKSLKRELAYPKFEHWISKHVSLNSISVIFLRGLKLLGIRLHEIFNGYSVKIFKWTIHPNVVVSQPFDAKPEIHGNFISSNGTFYR